MAIPTLSGGITTAGNTLSNADSTTGWSGTSVATDADIKVEGTAAVSCILRNDLSTIQYTNGTGINMSNQHFRGWINTTTLGQLDFMEAYIGGGFYIVFKGPPTITDPVGVPTYRGGYQYVVVYGGNTPDSGTAPGTETAFGFRFNRTVAPANRTNTYVDVFRYGDGYTATGGTLADPITFTTISDVDVVDAYGIVQNIRDTNFLFGEVTIGSGATATYMTVANEAVIFTDSPVSSTLYKITATGSGCTFDATNSLFKANGAQNFRFDMSAVNSLICEGNVFIQASPLVFASGQTITSNTFIDCGALTTGGATVVRGSFETCAPVVVADLANLSLCTFMGDNTQAAVELTSIGDGSMDWSCDASSGYASGSLGTFTTANDAGADAAIFVSATTGTITISVVSGGTVPSVRTAGATVIVEAQPTIFSVSGLKDGTEVRIINSSTNVEIAGVESVSGGVGTGINNGSGNVTISGTTNDNKFSYAYQYSADVPVFVAIVATGYEIIYQDSSLINTDRDIPVSQALDRTYSNP